uniref:Stromal cell-derived factor 2-like 1 n=1 Tax=Eptatretus burgeri TaxID=7764 RepID=A0A8C4N896_EPTBU
MDVCFVTWSIHLQVCVWLSLFVGIRGQEGTVTCGSVVKLLNGKHDVRLHSHDVKYGSGSGQQSVTAVKEADDGNSYWRLRGVNADCQRGEPVACGQVLRLTHMNTGRNLHSHHFSSPLSGQQEVSAFGEGGEGDQLDHWVVECSGKHWRRSETVKFKHLVTGVWLSVSGEQYGRPISGQREVSGASSPSQHSSWKAMEGVFLQAQAEHASHTEL